MGHTVHFEKNGIAPGSLFMATLGLCCCVQAFSSCRERGYPLVEVSRLLIAVTSRRRARDSRAQVQEL